MTPYEVLGVSNRATLEEITFAYRTAAQIFHPDRFVDAPEAVRREAERRMKELSEAYNKVRRDPQGVGRKVRIEEARARRDQQKKGATEASFMYMPKQPKMSSWEQGRRERIAAAKQLEEEKAAREAAAQQGTARPRPKPGYSEQSILFGLGEALVTNKLRCAGCRAVLHLPEGWKDTLRTTNYFCSLCDRKVLCR